MSNISKEKWIQTYASRILRLWSQWQTPLGVAYTYRSYIKEDLAKGYEDPLKKMFVETAYQRSTDRLFAYRFTERSSDPAGYLSRRRSRYFVAFVEKKK